MALVSLTGNTRNTVLPTTRNDIPGWLIAIAKLPETMIASAMRICSTREHADKAAD